MALWNLKALLITTALYLNNLAEAAIPSNCEYTINPAEIARCQKPLDDITIVNPGELIVAKLQCIGCPTVERTERGGHVLTHDENALLFTISLSPSRTALLVNAIELFPALQLPPRPNFLATQVPLNYSVGALAATLACEDRQRGCVGGRCDVCVENTLGAYSASFDYSVAQTPEGGSNAWTVHLDAIGGHNGYMVDPYVGFGALEQRVLAVYVKVDGATGGLEITGAELVERGHAPIIVVLTRWEKVLRFFGLESCRGKEHGHVVYMLLEWDDYGKVGTLKHFLLALWGEWPWYLITIITVSVMAGLAIIYYISKFAMEVRRIMIRNDRLSKGEILEDEDKEERDGLLNEQDHS